MLYGRLPTTRNRRVGCAGPRPPGRPLRLEAAQERQDVGPQDVAAT